MTAPRKSQTPAADAGAPLDEAEMLRRAEAAVAALKAQYPTWAEGHIAVLEAAAAKARDDRAGRALHLERLAEVAHDVKGEGTTYDYPLMTELGGYLHAFAVDLAKNPGACEQGALAEAETLIAAMRQVIADRLEGDGGAPGAALMAPIRARFGAGRKSV